TEREHEPMSSTALDSATGLTSDEARRRLAANGTNAVQDVVQHPIYRALKKLWGPVPRMLEARKSRLAVTASARRDGVWKTLSAAELVQGDAVKLSLGAVVPADVRLIDGSVLVEQSMLTGESLPIEAGPGFETYAGALIRRGEAVAEIIATGARTKFGRSAELIRI